jgi:hypothetical protein
MNSFSTKHVKLSSELQFSVLVTVEMHVKIQATACYKLWSVVYVYIETTTYRSDIQAFILVTCYTDVFTAGKR